MNEVKQRSLDDVLRNPYAAGTEARRIVEEISAIPGESSGKLRTRLVIIFRYAGTEDLIIHGISF